MTLPFDKAEYVDRLDRVKRAMEANGIEILLASDPSNMNYLTGYDGWSFYVPQLVLVAIDEAAPWWIGRKMDAGAARVTTWLPADHIDPYPDRYVQNPPAHPMDYVAEVIRRHGWGKRTVAVESDAYYYTHAGHAALERGLPDAHIVDSNLLVNWARIVKSPREIGYMREAARIIEATMRAGIDAVVPGARQCDAAAKIYAAQIAGTPDFGGDYTGLCPMLPTGIGTSTPHLTWTSEPFVTGEATILELAGCRQRYHCPMARTVHLGKPPQKLADTTSVVLEGMETALAAVKSGVTCESVEAAWRGVIARHGLEKESRIGYSTGIGYPPDWGEHTLSLRPGDRTELRENMTIHMILGMWMDDWGLEISECFRVGENGAECLASFPRELVVKA
jgi:Xaa-Pro aminopeptidase